MFQNGPLLSTSQKTVFIRLLSMNKTDHFGQKRVFVADCNFVIVLLNIPHLGRGNLVDRTVVFIVILLDPCSSISNINWNKKNLQYQQVK